MAGTVSLDQAEGYWTKYNKDGNDTLTVEEVKQCLTEVYETVDTFDVDVSETSLFMSIYHCATPSLQMFTHVSFLRFGHFSPVQILV